MACALLFFKHIRALKEQEKVQSGLTFHGLRTTLATDIAEAGGSEKEMMAVLGHRTEAMASHYSQPSEQEEIGDECDQEGWKQRIIVGT